METNSIRLIYDGRPRQPVTEVTTGCVCYRFGCLGHRDGGVGHIFLWHHHDHQERGDRFTVVSLFQLRPGMQLAEDINIKNQTVLMPAGFTLTQTRIHRMW